MEKAVSFRNTKRWYLSNDLELCLEELAGKLRSQERLEVRIGIGWSGARDWFSICMLKIKNIK